MLRLSQPDMSIWEEHGVWHFSADRDEQVRPAAEALRVVISGGLHIRDAQGEIKLLQGCALKARADEFFNV
jgi:hypothetical protein